MRIFRVKLGYALVISALMALLAFAGSIDGAGGATTAASGGTEADEATTTPTSTTPSSSAPSSPSPPHSKPHPKSLYRITGCVSRGGAAYRQGPARREVAIGFDDGPASDTPAFVTMLEHSHAQATFFMIGEQVSATYRAMLLRELRNGDVLGDHTFKHPELTKVSDVRSELQTPLAIIRSLTGYTPCVFRPPYGAYDQSVLDVARSLGLATVLWDVDPADYTQPGAAAIEQRVLEQVTPGSIVISHDGGGPRGQTLAAYPAIISALRARGYRIVTIPELLGFRPTYVPCIKLCDGIGIRRRQLPHDAILQRAP